MASPWFEFLLKKYLEIGSHVLFQFRMEHLLVYELLQFVCTWQSNDSGIRDDDRWDCKYLKFLSQARSLIDRGLYDFYERVIIVHATHGFFNNL